ncbi:UROD/MetE-like protein [Lentinus brumalis]|uniref:UROD/MetE-like protein n=1 Tax=Lentinus brumalis TaxID=2498619 RepID=A0A371DTD9_9APHY|nr:UROD/MetE-like protein [Polyporus brumalis]
MSASVPATQRIPHVDHVGSLLRPKELVELRIAYHAGKCSAAELKALEDEVVPKMVQLQKNLGLTVINDGEVRRAVYNDGIFGSLEGMTVPYLPFVTMFSAMGIKGFTSAKCTGKLRRTKPIHAHEFVSVREYVAANDVPNVKMTMCPPTWKHLQHGSDHTYDHNVYKNDAEYFGDVEKAYREEIQELYSLGCRRIQFDDPGFAFFCSEGMIAGMQSLGEDYDKLLDTYIGVYNAITADWPTDLVFTVHTCRGNMKGLHFSEGGYEHVAEKLFKTLNVDAFYLEYDTERAGGLEPLQYLPPGKHAVLGLVTTKSGALEDLETIKERVRRAAEIIAHGDPERPYAEALNQLAISPQCGFASVFEGNPITEEEERQKLALVVEAARQIWG